jgi:2-keto-4-pentenoate hydratase/2-oxohepta-3-ene-1,7-dioic acid hydratase in catechol pathway
LLICRYLNDGAQRFGIVEDDGLFELIGDPFSDEPKRGTKVGAVNEITLLPPVRPSKIVCVGRNYAAHAKEKGNEVPAEPLLFFKPSSALIGHLDSIELTPDVGLVEHEAELTVVIGTGGRNISVRDAYKHVLGYTCANDVSARDYQAKDGQWARAKGFDTFCPLGPWINTSLEPSNLNVRCTVNGTTRQYASTSQLMFDVPILIAHISKIMTLNPGDIILTGTPAGVGPIQVGDQVDVEIEGIGMLRNSVRATS